MLGSLGIASSMKPFTTRLEQLCRRPRQNTSLGSARALALLRLFAGPIKK
ncbi:unnamed protein product [Polarella glacialis]|uniref:Uncharacterized protein n=1 Tax=Polarella glacialis TaxID=89957 RepID=A0A813H0Q9_POLGL|nr:unnamed protein product [Polarella glacialis]